MAIYRYGGKTGAPQELVASDDYMVVRTCDRNVLFSDRPYATASISAPVRALLSHFELVTRFRESGVELLKTKRLGDGAALREEARTALNGEDAVQFAGKVWTDTYAKTPVLYTENFFVKFHNQEKEAQCRSLLSRHNLEIKQVLDYARNGYFVKAVDGTGSGVFEIAEQLLQEASVELCHPELVRQNRQRAVFPNQWHLKDTVINGRTVQASCQVEAAWALSKGEGITIAIVDDGVDIEHEEFRSSGKILSPRDVTRKSDNPRPGSGENHGTCCAGVACADGNFGASGVAPMAKLMPIRLASGLGSQAEAEAFVWAAKNGADVISCSWGPPDGVWYDAKDPAHTQKVALPDSTRLAINFAVTQGRKGKGCVVLFAAGNGNESVENDGYASNPQVMAVAACNDQGKRSAYSDYGQAVWCSFPSNNGNPSLTSGIWTTDRMGNSGYNAGKATEGDAGGNYTNSFGGTSSACPGMAGVVALMLARNPELRWNEVRELVKQSCERIDVEGGKYNPEGWSPLYGYGRINARKAVELSAPAQASPVQVARVAQDVPIKDLATSILTVTVAETRVLKSLKVTVDIDHTYIGDLVVTLRGPDGLKLSPVVLHNREGGAMDNIKRIYDLKAAPPLAQFQGKSPAGAWVLEVADLSRWDTGTLRSFALEIEV
jgi:subtilisin family serine protease